ncbi:MAG: TolC family protein [Clostridiales bacterium]|nr:TolC family protein [Clostridiales bacterium]
MKKRGPLIIIMIGLLVLTSATLSYSQDLTLKFNGLFEAFRTRPLTVDGTVTMAMRELCELLDVEVEWKDVTRTATLTKGDKKLTLIVANKTAYIDGDGEKPAPMPVAPSFINGNSTQDLMVPLRFVAEYFGATVGWEDKTKTILLDTGLEPLQIMAINKPTQANSVILTYEEALKNALSANSTLLNLQESIDYLNEKHNDAIDTTRMLGSQNLDLFSAQFIEALRGLRQIEDSLENIPHNEEVVKHTTEYMLRNSLSTLAADEMDLQMLKETIKLKEQNIKNLKLKLDLGMTSENDLTKAQQELDQDKVNVELLALRVQNDKSSLNKVLLAPLDKEYIVDFEPVVAPVSVANTTALINDAVNKDPTLLLKQIAMEAAKYAIDNYSDTEVHSKLEKETEYNRAARDLEDTRRNLESAVRTSYNKLSQLQENEKSLKIDLEKARNTYNTMTTNYKAGLVTLYDLDQAKVGILSAETALAKNEYNHWTLAFAVLHPFLLAGTSSAE